MIRIRALVLLVPLLLAAVPVGFAAAPPALTATSAVLMDVQTGRVIYALAPHLRRQPASTTKIMTALLVAETLTPDTLVPISRRASVERSGSAIGLEMGDRWTAGDLMQALLMHSANDAAVALAEAVGGSVEEFVAQMNSRARALGARETNFVTPHGRFHPQHYTTAQDLALIARAALRNRWIAGIVRSQTWELRRNGETRLLINTNKLLWHYPGADGVKTGWIAESGPCLVASATRGGWQLIAVVLNSPEMYHDASTLLTYGFESFTRVHAASRGEVVQTVPVTKGLRPLTALAADDATVVVPRGAEITRHVFMTKTAAPIRQGEIVGNLQLVSDGVQVGQVPLVAGQVVPVRSVFVRFWLWVRGLADGGGLP